MATQDINLYEDCPDEIREALEKANPTPDRIAEVSKALEAIATNARFGKHNSLLTLSKPSVMEAFLRDPSPFVRLSESIGGESIGGFPALLGDGMLEFFVEDPDRLIGSFSEFIEAHSMHASIVLNALCRGRPPRVYRHDTKRYLKKSKEYIELVRATGLDGSEAYYAFRDTMDLYLRFVDGEISEENFSAEFRAALGGND